MNVEATIGRRGFTLIEVLVALAIVALGLIGVFGQVSQSASAANRLREKTLASWVALNRLTELRLSGVFPRTGTTSGDVEMANGKWHWEMTVTDADEQKNFRRAEIAVSTVDKPGRPLAVMSGFVMQSSNVPAIRTPWVSVTGGPPGAEGQQQQPPPTPGTTQNPVSPPPVESGESDQ